jgi:hypothetical protein
MIGPGKYDDICTRIREELQAEGVVLIVCRGVRGMGFSAQLTGEMLAKFPNVLREIANQMDEDAKVVN